MRIGFDATLLYGTFSGVEYAIQHLLWALAAVDSENEYEVYVECHWRSDTTKCPANFHWRNTRFPGHRRLQRILWQQLSLPRLARKERVDVLHGPGYIIPLRCSVPSVVTVYDIIALTHPELCRLSNRLHYRFVLPRAICKAIRIIVPSRHVYQEVANRFPGIEHKLRVIPLGVDPRFFLSSNLERRNEYHDFMKRRHRLPERYVLFVGNLERKKNVVALVEAFHHLKRKLDVPHHLVLAGNASQMPEALLKSIHASDLEPLVHVLDYVEDIDLPWVYHFADVVAIPSLTEGFGLPVLEAMAAGTAVVASNRGSLPEVVGDAGLLCDPLNIDSIARALHRILSETDLRNDLIEKGRQRARQLTWSNTAKQVLEVYKEAAAPINA